MHRKLKTWSCTNYGELFKWVIMGNGALPISHVIDIDLYTESDTKNTPKSVRL